MLFTELANGDVNTSGLYVTVCVSAAFVDVISVSDASNAIWVVVSSIFTSVTLLIVVSFEGVEIGTLVVFSEGIAVVTGLMVVFSEGVTVVTGLLDVFSEGVAVVTGLLVVFCKVIASDSMDVFDWFDIWFALVWETELNVVKGLLVVGMNEFWGCSVVDWDVFNCFCGGASVLSGLKNSERTVVCWISAEVDSEIMNGYDVHENIWKMISFTWIECRLIF